MKGGIFIPNKDFITSILNIDESIVENLDVRSNSDSVEYDLTLTRRLRVCPYCGGELINYGHKTKKINHPVLRGKNGLIIYHANRYQCKCCRKISSEHNPFTFSGFNSSYLVMQNIMSYLCNLNYNLEMISKELNISTTQINKYLDSFIVIPKIELPESIGIDELHSKSLSKRGASYICIIVDNVDRGVFDVINTRSKSALFEYFSSFSKSNRDNVKFVTIDMWEPYKDVALELFHNCIVAVDPFHVIEHLIDGLEALRISTMKQCVVGSNQYYLLKKWKWLLTKSHVQLDNPKVYNHRFRVYMNRRDILELINKEFPLLGQAYWLKELYRDFNENATYEEACERFDSILDAFKCSKLSCYDEFINILQNWRVEILNSFLRPFDEHKLSNAYTENINGKLRTYLDISRGINNFIRFRKRVLYALNPKIYYSISSTLNSDKRVGKKRGPYNKIKE